MLRGRMIGGPIARATLRTSTVLAIRLAVQAGILLLIARLLGPGDFGVFAGVAALAILLGTLATFGMHLVLLERISRNAASRGEVLAFAIPTTLFSSVVLLSSYLLLARFVIAPTVPFDILVAIGMAEIVLQPLLGLVSVEHMAHGRTAESQALGILPMALRFLGASILWLAHSTQPFRAYAYISAIASALAVALARLTLAQPWPPLRNWRRPTLAELRHAGGFAALNITAAGPAEADKTLALKLLPLAAVGLYAAGTRVMGALVLPVLAMTLAALPRLFHESATDIARTRRLVRWLFGSTIVYSIVLALALWVAAPLFDVLFGREYSGLGDTLRWLSLAVPGMAMRYTSGSVLMSIGRPWMRVAFEITGLVVLVVAAVALVPRIPVAGMPLSLAFSEWTMSAIGLLYIFRATQDRIRERPLDT